MSPPHSFSGQKTSSTEDQQQSFTQMDLDRDLEAIGARCELEYCNQLDFLPFRCESCKHTFCLDHRSETAHKCAHAGEWAAARRKQSMGASGNNLVSSTPTAKPSVSNSAQCSHPSCKTLIHTLGNTGVHCQNCNREYCLKHRLREDHDCSKLTPLGARPASNAATIAQTQTEKARMAFSRLRTWGKEKTASATTSFTPKPKTSAASRAVALNALKKNAKGNPNLDTSKRFYVHVEASAETTTSKFSSGDFYFDSAWSIGKILDDAARRLQVQNVNNRVGGEEQRLRVFHIESGKLLEFSEKIGSGKVAQGDTLVLLRGVGPPVPDLIQA